MKIFRLDNPGLTVGLAVIGVAAVSAAIVARGRTNLSPPARDLHPYLELRVPRTHDTIPIDAEIGGKKVWEPEAGSTGNFKDANGRGMVPYTEAKARWTPSTLYLLLYAGDLDLEGTVKEPDGPVLRDDAFHVELGHAGRVYTLDVSVIGTLADSVCTGEVGDGAGALRCDPKWASHAIVAVDRDGTINQLGDNDEEWVVEMAIPLTSIGIDVARGGERIPMAIRRCEIGKNGPGACGGFGDGEPRGELVLEPDSVDRGPVASANDGLGTR
jgi:hypothetical protein